MSDFDAITEDYEQIIEDSIRFSGKSHRYFTQVKARILLQESRRLAGDPSRLTFLDLGCGIGLTDELLTASVQALYGVDLHEGVIAKAEARNPGGSYRVYDGRRLPYAAESFDIVFAICVLHHVPPNQWCSLSREAGRVLKGGGVFFIFEHNPLNPLTRYVVKRTPFDDDAVLLGWGRAKRILKEAGFRIAGARHFLFTPWEGRFFQLLEQCLGRVPFGAQYLVAGRK